MTGRYAVRPIGEGSTVGAATRAFEDRATGRRNHRLRQWAGPVRSDDGGERGDRPAAVPEDGGGGGRCRLAGGTLAGCSTGTASPASSTASGIWSELTRHLQGTLLRPGDPRYRALAPLNARYADVLPQGIALCEGMANMSRCVVWARSQHVPFAVRSGGHSYGGFSATPGLLISLHAMKGATLDQTAGTATVQGGVQNKDLIGLLPKYGLMIPNGRCPSVGVGGYVLGGGFGFNSRHLGLAVDKLVAPGWSPPTGRW